MLLLRPLISVERVFQEPFRMDFRRSNPSVFTLGFYGTASCSVPARLFVGRTRRCSYLGNLSTALVFVKLEGPLYVGGPIWSIEMMSPVWRQASHFDR